MFKQPVFTRFGLLVPVEKLLHWKLIWDTLVMSTKYSSVALKTVSLGRALKHEIYSTNLKYTKFRQFISIQLINIQ